MLKPKTSQLIKLIALMVISTTIILHKPLPVADPAASPTDQAREDLSRVAYPSTTSMSWDPLFIRPQDTLESLYGNDWIHVARFNRIDRRHVYPGMTIKTPRNMADIRNYTPMPKEYEPARAYERYILITIDEQWLGAYEFGTLVFSVPAATGRDGFETPVGVFRVDARHMNHTSSLYKTEDQRQQYPMDYAMRFHVGADNVSYWIHARDLPGRPASHGCVGVFDEDMQNRIFGVPEIPVLNDARKLYEWAVGDEVYEGGDSGDLELLEDGPIVEIVGKNPKYLPAPPRSHAKSRK